MPYLVSLLGYKVAILLLYLRLFQVDKEFKYATWVVLFFVVGYLAANIWSHLFGCSPISKFWHPTSPGHCLDLVKAATGYASLNVASDFIIFVLPLPVIWQLQLSPKEKIGVSLIFTMGAMYRPPLPSFTFLLSNQ